MYKLSFNHVFSDGRLSECSVGVYTEQEWAESPDRNDPKLCVRRKRGLVFAMSLQVDSDRTSSIDILAVSPSVN